MPTAGMTPDDAQRQRRVRRSVLVWVLTAAAFYVGFIILTLVRASK
jgi:hypothetical protein